MFDGTLDIDEFENWLRQFPTETQIGSAQQCHTCPIAQFLVQTKGPCEHIEVFEDEIFVRHKDETSLSRYDLAPWAQHFILAVDAAHVRGASVTASAGLAALGYARETTPPPKVEYL